MSKQVTVHVAVEYASTSWGGISTAVDLMARASARAGNEVRIVALGSSEESSTLEQNLKLHTIVMPELRGRSLYEAVRRTELGNLFGTRVAAWVDESIGLDNATVFIHNDELASLLEHLREAHEPCGRVVVSHGLAQQEHPDRPDLADQQDRAFAAASLVLAVSAQQADQISVYYPQARVSWIPLPLALLLSEEPLAAARDLAAVEAGSLVTAGRAVPQKGFDLLLSAIPLVPQGLIRTVRLITGHGDEAYTQHCRDLAGGLREKVLIEPWMSRTELFNAMRSSAALVVPSRLEPLGLIAAEAMALGVPVVGSRVGGLGDLLSDADTGFLVDAVDGTGPDPAALANVLAIALSQPPWVTQGPQRLSQFSVARFNQALDETIRR